jgi:hypothetical protein
VHLTFGVMGNEIRELMQDFFTKIRAKRTK